MVTHFPLLEKYFPRKAYLGSKADCYLLNDTLAKYRKRSGSISNHGYIKLIKWHYKLYREAEGRNPVFSLILTVRNLVFGVMKKIRYVKG